MTTPAEKAQQMLNAVKAGQTVFTKAGSCWMIVGPTATITPGARVTVTKKDGSTSEVIVAAINNTKSAQGVDYTVATFTEARAVRPAKPRTGYTEVRNATFGTGRRYHAQPGATQYADGFGGHSVQIWDES